MAYLAFPVIFLSGVGLLLLGTSIAYRRTVRITGGLVIVAMLIALSPFESPRTSLDAVKSGNLSGKPLIVLGLDGADWDYINPLIRRGKLPNLARLRQNSAWGDLRTIEPTKSPAVWTSIATGEPPSEHGITQFVGNSILGGSANFSRIHPVNGIGLDRWLPSILRLGRPLHAGNRREAAYWEIASEYDQPVMMLNWWMSWPASPVNGWMITERIHSRSFGSLKPPGEQTRVTFPPSLRDRIRSLRYGPGDVSHEDVQRFMSVSQETVREMQSTSWRKHQLKSEFKYMYSMFETNRRIATTLYPEASEEFNKPVDLLVTFRLLDIAGHTALRYSELTPSHPDVDPRDEERFGRVVTRAYQEIDRAVGQILDRRREGYVLVVSDHGFEYNPDAKKSRGLFDHDGAPDGIWMLSGPGVRNGYQGELSVYDVLPIAATVKGFPISDDWLHEPPRSVFKHSFREETLTVDLGSYDENYRPDPTVDRSNWNDRAFKNRLKALGYLE